MRDPRRFHSEGVQQMARGWLRRFASRHTLGECDDRERRRRRGHASQRDVEGELVAMGPPAGQRDGSGSSRLPRREVHGTVRGEPGAVALGHQHVHMRVDQPARGTAE